MSSSSSPVESRKSEVLGRKSSQEQNDPSDKDQEGELVTLDYDLDTSKGEKALKIILLGDSAVGKSKLVERFLLDGYAPQQLSTYALILYRYRTKVGLRDVLIDFWDTAGQERFRTITTAYYRGAMGIMLVYDITNEKSFDNIKNWIRNIEEHASADVEKMILGNKCDMNDRRQVSRSVISSVEAVTLYLSLVADRFDSSKEYA